jgi:hypothetical protein
MNTKGANILLSTTILLASCLASPALGEDSEAGKAMPETSTVKAEGNKTDESVKADSKAELKQEPQEPSPEDTKKIGQDRGIIITEIGKPAKPPAKATTADIKGKPTPTIKRVSTAGNQSFSRGLVLDTKKENNRAHVDHSLLIKPPSKQAVPVKSAISEKKQPAAAVKTSKAVATTPVVIKSNSEPLNIKTHAETAKVLPKHNESVATKSHKSIVVAPTVAGDQIVTAWLNKSGNKPHYSHGEKLQVNVAANKDCNLMIFNYDGEQLTQLFPNEYQASPLVKAGQTVEVGGEGFKFDFTASNPTSKPSNEKIFVYAYPIESDNSPISVAMARIPSSPFRAAEMTPEKYRELVNNSQAFFGRKVSVSAKKNEVEEVQLASYQEQSQAQGGAANKIELSLVIDGIRKN